MAGLIPHVVLSILTFPSEAHWATMGTGWARTSHSSGHGKSTTKKKLFDFGVCLAWAAFVTCSAGTSMPSKAGKPPWISLGEEGAIE